MNFRNLAIISSLICFTLVAIWMLVPGILLVAWGVEYSYSVGLLGRRSAALFAGIGIMFFLARNAEPSSARSALVIGLAVGSASLAALGGFELATGHAGVGILSAVIVEIALALSCLHIARRSP